MVEIVPGAEFVPSRLPMGRVAVMFAADWCGYSRRFLRHFEEVQGGVVVDISDEDDPLWDIYAIRLVPTVVLFQDQEPLRRWVGVLGESHAREVRAALAP